MSFTSWLLVVTIVCLLIWALDYLYGRLSGKLLEYPVMQKIIRFLQIKYVDSLLIFIFSFLILFLFNAHQMVNYNNYSYLADSLLHGRVDVNMPDYLEKVIYNGKEYMHLAPGPALFVLPFVAVWGIGFNIAIISVVLGAANVAIFYNILKRLNINSMRVRLWLSALLGFGTVHFWLAARGDSWFLGQVSTMFFTLLALYFIFDTNKDRLARSCFLSGLFFGLAVACRITLIVAALFFIIYILKVKEFKIKGLLYFVAGAFIPGSLYMIYNYLRFGTVMDSAYFLKYKAEHPEDTSGAIQFKFLPYNLYSMFIMAPNWIGQYPFIHPGFMGVSLTFTSPALYYAIKAKGKKWFIALTWVTIFILSIPFIMGPGNGFAQFGMRYSLDFTPFLMLLVASALKDMDNLKKFIILACIWINAWGVLYWRFFDVNT